MMKPYVFAMMGLAVIGKSWALQLESRDMTDGGVMPLAQQSNVFGCAGGNRSPHLQWREVPQGTTSFALSVYDPDAPTGSGFWHWMVVNLPATVTEIPAGIGAGEWPEGTQVLKNDLGERGWLGSCPPPGQNHRYLITLYALDTTLAIGDDATPALAGFMINQHLLAKDTVIVTHGR